MRSDSLEIWLSGALLVVVLFLYGVFSAFQCESKTSGMGFENRWGPVMGCQIEVNPNQWIPLESYYFKQE